MKIPEGSGAEFDELMRRKQPDFQKNEDLVQNLPYDFSTFLIKFEHNCRQQGIGTEPIRVSGQSIHHDLQGTDFEIYPLPLPRQRDGGGRSHDRYLVGVKFIGHPPVTWAGSLQNLVLECESTEEAMDWLRLEAVIRSEHKEQTAAETRQSLRAERNMDEVIEAVRSGKKPEPQKQRRKPARPLTKEATV